MRTCGYVVFDTVKIEYSCYAKTILRGSDTTQHAANVNDLR